MTSGIYALASLDGAPLRNENLALLGLEADEFLRRANGLAVRIEDEMPGGPAISFYSTPNSLAAFSGYLDEAEELKARLGVATNNAAELALAALEKFGNAAAAAIAGEWSLLHWDVRARKLTLLASETIRDAMCWATNGQWIAVAPKPLTLCRLPWVGHEIDPEGFALYLSRAGLRKILTHQTAWKNVSCVVPGVREGFAANRRESVRPAVEPSSELWTGSFEEAVEAASVLLRRVLGQQLRRYGCSGFLLSGGIDSSLLTAHAALEQQPGAEMFCLSSVAPPGSGLLDEYEFSSAVAAQTGVKQYLVCPGADINPYRPDAALWQQAQVPVISPRHYLQKALYSEAGRHGARAVVDGAIGEYSFTQSLAYQPWLSWQQRMRAVFARWRKRQRDAAGWPALAFHARLSKELFDMLPQHWSGEWKRGPVLAGRRMPHEAMGLHPAANKSRAVETGTAAGLRRIMPFRDPRIRRMAARFPAGFSDYEGMPRSLARAMLRDKVPDAVRLRPSGRPFSPDYGNRMQAHAAACLGRMPAFYAAGADQFVDLPWLSETLIQLQKTGTEQGGKQDNLRFPAQATACAAEFLVWAAEQR